MANSAEDGRRESAASTNPCVAGTAGSQKSVSLAKTMRPGLLAVVKRDRLFEAMDRGAERGITWVAGPPGAGKTTLVSSYLEHRRLTHLWYQVDRGDVDAATFFHYLGMAASRERSLAGAALPPFSPTHGTDLLTFARRYFRELYRCLASPFALVFDNYQEAPLQSPLPSLLGVAVEEMRRSGSVFVISRHEPPRELARLRANQQIELIGWSDLRLSTEELRGIARKRGQTLGEEACRNLHRRTQGWAAGAVLMLEHAKIMGTEAEPPCDNTPQVVFDYVAGEIFEKFEPESQAFLLSTACLSQMTPETAEKVSGYSKAGPLLANLARNDYFVSERFADGERVYQFHRLLSAFLRRRARQAYATDDWTRLVRRSAGLLADAGQPDEAIALLLDESHWEGATEMIVAHAGRILDQGRSETLMGWLDEIPSTIAATNPWVLYWKAASRRSAAPREARRHYERAHQGFRECSVPSVQGVLLSCCGIIDTIVGEGDDFGLLDPWMEELVALWSEHRSALPAAIELRVVRCVLVALLARRPGDAALTRWLENALNLCREHPRESIRHGLQPAAGFALLWRGGYLQAADLLGAIRADAASVDVSGDALAELEVVESLLRTLSPPVDDSAGSNESPRDTGLGKESEPNRDPSVYGAIAYLNDGALDAAEDVIDGVRADPASMRRLERGLCHYLRAWLSMERDDKLNAHQHLQAALGVATEIGSPAFELLCRIAWAEILSSSGDLRKAESQLRHAQEARKSIGSPLLDFMTGIAATRVAIDGGRRDEAVDELSQALSAGRRQGFTHTLWWRSASMASLCALALEKGIESDYVRGIIRSRRLAPNESAMGLASWPWQFQVFTLGKFRILKGGATQGAPGKSSRRPLELLKVLVALGGRDVKVEHLTDILWPNVDGDYAYGSFTSALHRLRRWLERDDAILLQDGRLSLNARFFWVDTWAIEQALAEPDGRTEMSPADPSTAATVDRVLELYVGAFLEDESDSTCYVALREHLRGKVLRLLTRAARFAGSPGEIEKAIDYFERAIDADPLCEGFYRGLMTLYVAADRRSEALEVYNRCRAILTSTLRISPSSETVALFEKLSHDISAL